VSWLDRMERSLICILIVGDLKFDRELEYRLQGDKLMCEL